MRGILQLMARDPSRHAHSERKCRANEKKKLLYLTYYQFLITILAFQFTKSWNLRMAETGRAL